MPAIFHRRRNRILTVLAAVLAIATAGALTSLGGQRTSGDERAAGPAQSVDEVRIEDFRFQPDAVTVAVGTTITFTNRDRAPHTATSGSSPSPDGVFDTDVLRTGRSGAVTLTKAGTFAYYCALHPLMKATVVVR